LGKDLESFFRTALALRLPYLPVYGPTPFPGSSGLASDAVWLLRI
jgi:hypothetical protein